MTHSHFWDFVLWFGSCSPELLSYCCNADHILVAGFVLSVYRHSWVVIASKPSFCPPVPGVLRWLCFLTPDYSYGTVHNNVGKPKHYGQHLEKSYFPLAELCCNVLGYWHAKCRIQKTMILLIYFRKDWPMNTDSFIQPTRIFLFARTFARWWW